MGDGGSGTLGEGVGKAGEAEYERSRRVRVKMRGGAVGGR
jgi:hypothetical protein